MVVSLAAVFWERFVTSQKTAAKETGMSGCALGNRSTEQITTKRSFYLTEKLMYNYRTNWHFSCALFEQS